MDNISHYEPVYINNEKTIYSVSKFGDVISCKNNIIYKILDQRLGKARQS